MCADRCFSSPNESETSSHYTRTTKQKTIFNDVIKQVQGQTNFIKSNGVNYNQNFGLHNNCLAFAKSYDLLLDVTKGKYLCSPVEDPNWVSNEAWSAGLYSVDYSANNVNVVVDTSYNAGNGNRIIFPMTQSADVADISWNGLYPGVIVDPSYNIFYNECNDQNNWRKKLVDMSFNNTNYYKQSKQKSEQSHGMFYPGNVRFGPVPVPAPICGIIDILTIATNMGGNNWSIVANKTIEICQILNIDNGIVLGINAGVTLTVKGTININAGGRINNNAGGTIENHGTIDNKSNIGILNSGIINNNNGGIINNNAGGNVENDNGGIINNNNGGIINNNAGSLKITNTGGTINNTGGTINNTAEISNENGSTINNTGGQINNNLTIGNFGTINNTGEINTTFLLRNINGTIKNFGAGIINNNDGGQIQNNANTFLFTNIIYNFGGGTINTTGGTFFNFGTFNNPTIDIGCGIGFFIGTISAGNPIVQACPPP